jgi:cell division protease FtsH
MVMRLPEGDRISLSRAKLFADLRVACGGRIAEELTFGEEYVTTGASSDIKMVSDMSRRMVTEWGMSERLGFLAYGADQQEVFLGHSVTQTKNVSDATAKIIDEETRRIIDNAYIDATKILKDNIDQLEALAKGLLEYETLSGDEINALLAGEAIVRDGGGDEAPKQDGGRRTSVPTGGSSGKPSGDMGPDPQPGD